MPIIIEHNTETGGGWWRWFWRSFKSLWSGQK